MRICADNSDRARVGLERPTSAAPAVSTLEAIRILVENGPPPHPVPDFDRLIADLGEKALAARDLKKESENVLLEDATRLVEELDLALETTEEQMALLEGLRGDFEEAGIYGADHLESVERTLSDLGKHQESLRGMLEISALAEAQNRVKIRFRALRDRALAKLNAADSRAAMDLAVNALLEATRRVDAEWAVRRMTEIEDEHRRFGDTEMLAPILRFWSQIRSLVDDPQADEVAKRVSAIRQELSTRADAAAVEETVRDLVQEIRTGIAHLDHVGEEERIALIHVWLGRLRKQQDEVDIPEDLEREIRFTFGALNSATRRFEIDHYFDALARKFTADWDSYIARWQETMDDARTNDRMAIERKAQKVEMEEHQRRVKEEREAKKKDRLAFAVEELRGLADVLETAPSPEQEDELRSLLQAGVEADGCRSDEFLKAALAYPEYAYGPPFRGLRRSLRKRGAEEGRLGSAKPLKIDQFESEFARLRPRLEGTRVAIVGGIPNEATRQRVETGLGLDDLRWYEHYRESNQHDAAEASIRTGSYSAALLLVRYAGHKISDLRAACDASDVPWAQVDRGCGVGAILRGLRQALPQDSRSIAPTQ